MKVLLTGASGFLGSHIAKALASKPDIAVVASLRGAVSVPNVQIVRVADVSAMTDWSDALYGTHLVIHTAARAHVIKDNGVDPLAEYRRVNVDGTLNLARQAAEAGVSRFLFVSSIGVNGNINSTPFTEDDEPNPCGLYAQSKWEAEQGLWEVQRQTGIEVVIIRPPLVYGPNAPGNFGSLVKRVAQGVPLPLGAIYNSRSLVAVDNLVDLIINCIDHPAAANQVFLAGDGQDLSTTELLQGVAKAMDKPSRLFRVPSSWLIFGATFFGKRIVAQKLLGSLQVDISKARNLLGWKPPISVEEGLRRCFESRER
ncbi:SDR family oxidoreductase [Marinobacterium sp. xm-d-564]|uniref:UDP-glucose 4-epimerase family protein n=1 Tax=Marinobacterium sp. xm-d-564 TaxID=2497742 RepID=UPI0015683D45|nr:SDR family oxidoreductase [Marinobacterium sp. xm-d-564]NRP58439.1 UDP-glucose 4-epimerase [Marinobacterium sp. xm-d-564]